MNYGDVGNMHEEMNYNRKGLRAVEENEGSPDGFNYWVELDRNARSRESYWAGAKVNSLAGEIPAV
ncbi:hypothetical protein Q5O14_16405 [Eubacteriaceae bacterium ES2]|nr:hypothetical protein Q5O14_16405 [Eubacteriaceae bacterium ES2]